MLTPMDCIKEDLGDGNIAIIAYKDGDWFKARKELDTRIAEYRLKGDHKHDYE